MNEFLESCKDYWTNWFFGIVATILAARLYSFRKKQEAQRMKQCALEAGMQALLKDRLIQAYEHYAIEKKCITLNGLGAVNDMFDSYEKFSDDETTRSLVEKMRLLQTTM